MFLFENDIKSLYITCQLSGVHRIFFFKGGGGGGVFCHCMQAVMPRQLWKSRWAGSGGLQHFLFLPQQFLVNFPNTQGKGIISYIMNLSDKKKNILWVYSGIAGGGGGGREFCRFSQTRELKVITSEERYPILVSKCEVPSQTRDFRNK